jgi:murein DD-endopeptidase MepM/ murein hydrolase activator NlpD
MTYLKNARFTEHVIQANSWDEDKFGEWLLDPGMLFGASQTWWGKRGNRARAHEGLDLCAYRYGQDIVCGLAGVKIPALYDGVVAGMIKDFLGQSLIVRHNLVEHRDHEGCLCTIYGHTAPQETISVGKMVREGEIIASVSDAGSRRGIIPHLHLSIGLITRAISYRTLDWTAIGDPDTMTLIDPLAAIGRYDLAAAPFGD